MRALILNSSPRAEKFSTTKSIVNKLSEGIRMGGGETEIYDLHKMDIKTCKDCCSCATNSQGKCIIDDDMTRILFPKFLSTDILVLATPIYFGTLSSTMKNFIERLFPYLGPSQEVLEHGVKQVFRGAMPKTVIVSSASWHYSHAFDQMSSYFRYLFEENLIAELYRGSSNAFLFGANFLEKKNEILEAAVKAGLELAEKGSINCNIEEIICQDIGELEKTVTFHNLSMELCRSTNMNTIQFANQRLNNHDVIQPTNRATFIELVKFMYDEREMIPDLSVVFNIKDTDKGICSFQIKNSKLTAGFASIEHPDLTIGLGMNTLINTLYGNKDFMAAVMEGKIILTGKLSKLQSVLDCLFSHSQKKEAV